MALAAGVTRHLVLALTALSATLLLVACGDDGEDLDLLTGEAHERVGVDPAEDPEGLDTDPADDAVADADEPDGAFDGSGAEARDLDPRTVALACDAVGYLAGYSGLGGDELEGEATLGGLIGEVELQRAMMEVAHPELELGSIEELRVTSLERADTALQRVNGAPSDTGADLSGADFGRAWDAVGHLVAVEDADGELRFLLGGPWFEDPEPLIAAGCDRIEVEAVAGRSLPELFGLDWMAEATGPRPGPLPILDIIGIGERAMDPSLTADDPVRTCPLAHWTERVEIVGLGFHPFGISMVCAGDAGIPVHLTPHGLRHSAITIGLDAGVSLRDMQDFARHADPKTTRRYDRSRHALNRHATSAIAHYLAGGN